MLRGLIAFLLLLAAPAWAQLVPWPPAPLVKLAVNPVTNKVYVLDEANDAVIVLDAATGATRTVSVGDRPVYVAVNPVTNRIYVNNAGDSSLTVIDGATDTNLTPAPLALGSLGPIAINTATNIVYVIRLTGPGTDEVTFFNGNDHGWYTIATESFQPISIAIDPVTNTLYAAHYATGDVRVISAASDGNAHPTTFSIGVWSRPFAIAANPVTNKIYVITEDARGPIAIIDGATRTATFPAITSGHAVGPKGLAVNTVTNKVYAAFNGEVIVIDGATGGLTYVPVDTGSGPAEVGVNAATNMIYVANASGTLTVINGADNTTRTIAIAAGVDSLGVNPVTNEVFLSGSGGIELVEGSPTDPVSAIPLTVAIAPKPSHTTGPNTEFTLTASSGFAPHAPAVRKVYVQLDTREGAWREASGSGPYTAAFTGLSPGNHVLYAFATDGQDAPLSTGAQSNPLVGTIASYAFTVTAAAPRVDPTVSLGSSQNPATVGTSVTFTATVSGSAGTPTGNLEFRDGSTPIAGCSSVALAGGAATCATTTLGVGTHSITAHYAGDAAYNAAASAPISQVIARAASSVALSSSANPSAAGESVTFTANVSGSGGVPAGTVEFRDGGATLAGCAAVTLVSGSAACNSGALAAGSHSISAHYSGDDRFLPASSTALSQGVNAAGVINVASAAAGAVASASSIYGMGYPASAAINGERAGSGWGSGAGGWNDGTGNAYPDWLEVAFNGPKSISRVVVYTVQDNYASPGEPTDSMTFTRYGIVDFTVEGWNGSAWVTLAAVTGNNLVKRSVEFATVLTDRIRINVTKGQGGHARITEVEAFGVAVGENVALSSAGASASASSTYGAGYPAAAVNNGDRRGANWGSGGGWNDGSGNTYPDWVQVAFNGTKRIDRVVVFTVQDNYGNPVEPHDNLTFTRYGVVDFTVEGWDGGGWVTLAAVTGNNQVKRTVSFDPFVTDRIRIVVTRGQGGFSRITEIEAWGSAAATNVALASAGASASASSLYGTGYGAAGAINGDRRGTGWGSGGGWNDGSGNAYPDWLQVAFAGVRTIDRVVVYTVQDNYASPVEPTDGMTFTRYGVVDFTVEGWNGSAWTPLGTVSGNALVKRSVAFAPFATDRIRISVTNGLGGFSRIVEVEAWGQ